jgi:Flp pilus assembly protein TadB
MKVIRSDNKKATMKTAAHVAKKEVVQKIKRKESVIKKKEVVLDKVPIVEKKEVEKVNIFAKLFKKKKKTVIEELNNSGASFPFTKRKVLDASKKYLSTHEKMKIKAKKEKKKPTRRDFQLRLTRSGFNTTPEKVLMSIRISAVVLALLSYIGYILYLVGTDTYDGWYVSRIAIAFFTVGVALFYGFSWFVFHQIMDMRMYNRKKEVEEVLADFLLLTSANVRAGMTIDKALWHAVRPRFGILAREIEMVAKRTLSGDDLDSALYEFAESFDSVLLKRSVSLLVEGLNAGGEIASLLNNIALNIQETQILKKEMSSAVTTYAIFIQFATVVAAPFLFALAGELLKVVSKLSQVADIDSNVMAQSGFAFSFGGGGGLVYSDFLIFAMITLTATSVLSNVIVSTIKKGDAREAFTAIPGSLAVTLAFFFLISYFLGQFLGGVI